MRKSQPGCHRRRHPGAKDSPALRKSLSEKGLALYQANYTTAKIGAQFKQYLMQLVRAAK